MTRTLLRAAALLVALALPRVAGAVGVIRIDETRSITVAVGLRTSFSAANAVTADGRAAGVDLLVDGALLSVGGELDKRVRFQINGGRAPTGELRVLDAMLVLEPHELFRVWLGRMLPPGDRASFVGPFFGTSWDPPFASAYPSAAAGRDDGLVIWGQPGGGRFKYYLGAFRGRRFGPQDNLAVALSSRVTVNLLDPEPGYYAVGTYFGLRDILSLGLGARYQQRGAGTDMERGNYFGWNADVFVEKKLGEAGAVTFEAAYYRYDTGGAADMVLVNGQGYFVSAGYLLPQRIGPGQIQPVARWQALEPVAGPRRVRYEVGTNYALNGHFTRIGLTASAEEGGGIPGFSYALKLGVQIIL